MKNIFQLKDKFNLILKKGFFFFLKNAFWKL